MQEFLTQRKKLIVPTERDRVARPEKVDRISLINADNMRNQTSSMSATGPKDDCKEPGQMLAQGQLQELQQRANMLDTSSVISASKWFNGTVPLGHSQLMKQKGRDQLTQHGEIEITDRSGMIEANTKVVVRRVPMKEVEPIEIDYNVDRLILYNTGQDFR